MTLTNNNTTNTLKPWLHNIFIGPLNLINLKRTINVMINEQKDEWRIVRTIEEICIAYNDRFHNFNNSVSVDDVFLWQLIRKFQDIIDTARNKDNQIKYITRMFATCRRLLFSWDRKEYNRVKLQLQMNTDQSTAVKFHRDNMCTLIDCFIQLTDEVTSTSPSVDLMNDKDPIAYSCFSAIVFLKIIIDRALAEGNTFLAYQTVLDEVTGKFGFYTKRSYGPDAFRHVKVTKMPTSIDELFKSGSFLWDELLDIKASFDVAEVYQSVVTELDELEQWYALFNYDTMFKTRDYNISLWKTIRDVRAFISKHPVYAIDDEYLWDVFLLTKSLLMERNAEIYQAIIDMGLLDSNTDTNKTINNDNNNNDTDDNDMLRTAPLYAKKALLTFTKTYIRLITQQSCYWFHNKSDFMVRARFNALVIIFKTTLRIHNGLGIKDVHRLLTKKQDGLGYTLSVKLLKAESAKQASDNNKSTTNTVNANNTNNDNNNNNNNSDDSNDMHIEECTLNYLSMLTQKQQPQDQQPQQQQQQQQETRTTQDQGNDKDKCEFAKPPKKRSRKKKNDWQTKR
jgi:hypothetical protein